MLNSAREVLLATLLLCGLAAAARAQAAGGGAARRVDTYDDQIRGSEAEQWRLEEFREALLKEPKARAHIVAYGGREDNPGKARRYALRARNWLVNWRGVDPGRITAAEGGRREEFAVELWLVPEGAPPPAPAPTVTAEEDPADNLLYDEFEFGYDNFAGRAEDAAARLGGFAAALKREPESWGCVIAYAESGDDRRGMEWDAPGTARKLAAGERSYLIKEGRVAPSKVTAVDGGYGGRVVALWVMRPRARFDKGPFIYPGRLRAGRGGTLTVDNTRTPDLCCKACTRGRTDPYILRGGASKGPGGRGGGVQPRSVGPPAGGPRPPRRPARRARPQVSSGRRRGAPR